LLIVSGGTARKRHRHPNALRAEDFGDAGRFGRRERELAAWMLPAGEMYAGAEHLLTQRAVGRLREAWGEEHVTWRILSAGYGLVPAMRPVAPYTRALPSRPEALAAWSERAALATNLERALRGQDLVAVLLGRPFLSAFLAALNACGAPASFLIFAPPETLARKTLPACHFIIPSGRAVALEERVSLVALKGHVFALLARALVEAGPAILDRLAAKPALAGDLLRPLLRSSQQARLL
jgi:hypothetical protein